MYPHDVPLFGATVSVWNAVFALAVVVAYAVFRVSARSQPRLTQAGLRYAVVVYLSAISAQAFAYAFDVNTTLAPPPGIGWAAWYLDPLAGPKTLYGVIVLMPVSIGLATLGTRLSLGRALDLWTPAMLVVLATVRVGCLLEGCCYGARSDVFGIAFPAGAPVYYQQTGAGLLAEGAPWSLPVVPTQGIEALFLATLAAWSWKRQSTTGAGGGARFGLFLPAIAAYSCFRFAIEFVRADVERGVYGPLATSQWIALAVLAATFVQIRRRDRQTGARRTPAHG